MAGDDPGSVNLDLQLGPLNTLGDGGSEPRSRTSHNVTMTKTCENGNGLSGNKALNKKDDIGKNKTDEGSFFDCNICLDLARDPVVTCCGHLFCWRCLYRWLHHHSDASECPVCKGEVTMKSITPIYRRGDNSLQKRESDSSTLKIPLRPQPRRVESWREPTERTALLPTEEMVGRLGGTFDLRGLVQVRSGGPQESPVRTNSLLNSILTSRGMHEEPAPSEPSLDINEVSNISRLRRTDSARAARLSHLTPLINSDAILDIVPLGVSTLHHIMDERTEGPRLPLDDMETLSSIAGVIQSGSQTIDNAIEIDSLVALSTLSSRRRNDGSRISDVDSGDSREPRRRRLN